MRTKKLFIMIYLIITGMLLITVTTLSWTIFRNIKNIRIQELHETDVERFEHLESVVEDIDGRAKSYCVVQFLDTYNVKTMLADTYDARSGKLALDNFLTLLASDDSIHSAYVYNGTIDKYIGASNNDTETEDIYEKIRQEYNGQIPKLRPLPMVVSRYDNEKESNVLTYTLYDELNANEKPEGGVVINFKIDGLKSLVESVKYGSARMIILDADNRVIMDTANATEFRQVPDKQVIEAMEKSLSSKKQEICKMNGEKVVVNSFNMNFNDWKYVNIVSYNEYIQPVNALGRRILVMVILFILLACITAIYIADIIYVPMSDLLVRISKVGSSETIVRANSRHKILTPTALLTGYFSDIAVSLEKQLKPYMQEKRREQIRSGMLYGRLDAVELKGSAVMFQIYNMEFGELYISHVFNMIHTYIDEYSAGGDEFVVLNKSQAVAVLNMPMEQIRELCERVVKDAELCDVTLSAFIGRDVRNSKELHDEFMHCQAMSRYQLMNEQGMVYDYKQYDEDAKKVLQFQKERMDAVINEIVSNADSTERKRIIGEYLHEISNNSIHNFIDLYMKLINSIQEICHTISPQKYGASRFMDINTTVSTAESFLEVVNMVDSTAEIAAELYLRQTNEDSSICAQVEQCIRDNISDVQLSPAYIAETIKVSQRKMSHEYKEQRGISIPDAINKIRLEKVAQMLTTVDEPIKSIMLRCGFVNESNFYKLFKKYYHVTPAVFKHQRERENENHQL